MPRKRGNNEGSITKRSDGRWMGRVTLPDGRRKHFYAKTRAEVSRKVTRALRAMELGTQPSDDRLTLAQFLDEWLEESALPSVRPATYRTHDIHVRLHIAPALGRIPLTRLAPQHVQQFMNELLEDGLASKTVCNIRGTLRRALGQAAKWELVSRNVAALADPPKIPQRELDVPNPEEARELLRVAEGHPLEALITTALTTGMRRGELLGLAWDDVDLDGATLTVRRAPQRIDGELRLVEPKSARSRRTIALPPVTVAALRQLRVEQDRMREAGDDDWVDSGFVFTSTVGTPLDGDNVSHRFRKLLEEAGFPPWRFHDLRHACATFLLAQGASPRVVMEQLGHSQISVTMNTYAHVMPEGLRAAADAMEDLLADDSG
jgi:integrase